MPIFIPIDLETTGLDARSDYILEVAWATNTSLKFDLENDISSAVVTSGFDHGEPETLCNEFVTDMHTESGLFAEIQAGRDLGFKQSVADIEATILTDINWLVDNEFAALEDPIYVLGNSVHFDLGFINVHMPLLAQRVSHRIVDVTSFLLVEDALGLPSSRLTIGTQHRAADDIRASLTMLYPQLQRLALGAQVVDAMDGSDEGIVAIAWSK